MLRSLIIILVLLMSTITVCIWAASLLCVHVYVRKAERDIGKPYAAFVAELFEKCRFEFYSSANLMSFGVFLQSLSLTCLFMLLPHLLTLSTHHCHHPYLALSFTPGSRPIFSQIFPTIDSLRALGLTPRTLWLDRFFCAFRFLFLASSLLFFFVSFRAADYAGYSSAFWCTSI